MVSVAWDYYKNFHMSSKRTHNLHFSPRNTWCPQNDHKNFKVYSALDHFVDIKCFWCFATNTQLRRNPSEAMLSPTTYAYGLWYNIVSENFSEDQYNANPELCQTCISRLKCIIIKCIKFCNTLAYTMTSQKQKETNQMRFIAPAIYNTHHAYFLFQMSGLTSPVSILSEQRKLTYIIIFKLLCGALQAFMKPFEAPQRSVKIKI